MKCSNCGTENPKGAKFCEKCGKEISVISSESLNLFSHRNMIFVGIAVVAIVVLIAAAFSGVLKPNSTALTINNNNSTVNNSNTNPNSNPNTNNPNNPSVSAQRELCKDCGGKGYYTCNVCGGSGRDPINPMYPCPGGQKPCDHGIVHCYTCGGDGYIDSGDPGYMR